MCRDRNDSFKQEQQPVVTASVPRVCVHCYHEWDEQLTREDLRKLMQNQPVSKCPSPECGLPT